VGRSITCYVSFGDTHVYDVFGLMPPWARTSFGAGATYSEAQAVLWGFFREFFDEFVPWATRGEPYALVHGGDIIDGFHHKNTTHTSADEDAVINGAVGIFEPMVAKAAAYYQLAGTPAHDGQAWYLARAIARRLGAVQYGPDPENHLRPELLLRVGDGLIHDTHHVSTTGLAKSMPTGITSDVVEQFIQRAKLNHGNIPDVYLRHHCHHASRSGGFLRDPCKWWDGMTIPGWQLKGPYPWKVGARNHETHFGGAVIRWVTDPWSGGKFELLPYTRGVVPAEPTILEVPDAVETHDRGRVRQGPARGHRRRDRPAAPDRPVDD